MRTKRKGTRVSPWMAGVLTVGIYVYVLLVFGWFILYLCFGDRWWWLFMTNTFAVYLFLPLPLAFAAGLALQRVDTWIGIGATIMLGGYLYGGLFLPSLPRAHAHNKMLVAMTYNLLVFNTNVEGAVAALRDSNADVIGLQELNLPIATAIQNQLRDRYPYQLIDAHPHDTGMGIISRYPLKPTGEMLTGRWIGTPQIVTLDIEGTAVTVINLHNISFSLSPKRWRADIEQLARERERQAQHIIDVAAAHPGPFVVMGDFNTAELSMAHRVLTSKLHDSWREGGYGLGHTFPGRNGSDTPLSLSPSFYGVPIPMWLVRIDYIFHSDELQTISARIGPWDGRSDHRPVIAELSLVR